MSQSQWKSVITLYIAMLPLWVQLMTIRSPIAKNTDSIILQLDFPSCISQILSSLACFFHELLLVTSLSAVNNKLKSLTLCAERQLFSFRGDYLKNSVKNQKLTNISNFKFAIPFFIALVQLYSVYRSTQYIQPSLFLYCFYLLHTGTHICSCCLLLFFAWCFLIQSSA